MNNQSKRPLLATVVALAWPAMLEQALQTCVQYADSAMVGRLGVQATAAVGLTTTVTWLTNSPLWALGIGVLACVARAVGAGDERTARSAAMQAVWMALISGALLTLLTQWIAPHLPGWLNADPEILIMDEPTRGIDVGAKWEIYGIINELAAQGKAVILISSELPEVLGMSDRVLVVKDDAIVAELTGDKINAVEVMRYAL